MARGRGNTKRRSTADKVLAQGTGRAVSRAFGTNGGKKVRTKGKVTRIPRELGLPRGAWDAFANAHAPLPRSVGPYTVVRTTRLVTSDSRFMMFGTFQKEVSGTKYWSNVVCASGNKGYTDIAINAPNSTDFFITSAPGGNPTSPASDSFTCVPSAISVQVMGQDSLQTSSGQYAIAVVPARMDFYADNRSWDEVSNEFVAYMRPRLVSGGKLALRGIQMDSMPLSMADVSEFLPMYPETGDKLANQWSSSLNWRPRGWAPMCVFNEAEKNMTYLVTVEWRVRFDMSNPAVASHSHHGISSDKSWDAHIRSASAALPGVIDIVEKVANAGMAVYRANQGGYAPPMIVD